MSITVLGTGFVQGVGLPLCRIGSAPSSVAIFHSPTKLECVTPAGVLGAVEVEVSNNGLDWSIAINDGAGDGLAFFRYHPLPTIHSIEPRFGSALGGTVVTVTGANLLDSGVDPVEGVPLLACRFGSTIAPAYFISASSVACTAPHQVAVMQSLTDDAEVTGMDVSVSVTFNRKEFSAETADGTFNFTYRQPPRVRALSPRNMPFDDSSLVTITGDNLGASEEDDTTLACRLSGVHLVTNATAMAAAGRSSAAIMSSTPVEFKGEYINSSAVRCFVEAEDLADLLSEIRQSGVDAGIEGDSASFSFSASL
jgi:hypothetical protein